MELILKSRVTFQFKLYHPNRLPEYPYEQEWLLTYLVIGERHKEGK